MPFKSKDQMKFFFAAEDRGDLPKGTARRWAHETPNIKKLPKKVKKKKRKRMRKRSMLETAFFKGFLERLYNARKTS